MTDNVNSPPHYTLGGIETLDYIEAKMSPEAFEGYLKGNLIKYISRSGHKGDSPQHLEDLMKARYYLNKLIETQSPNS